MRISHLGAGLLALATALSCFSDRSAVTAPLDENECSIPGDAIGPNRTVVLIRGFAFHPDTVRIRPGTTVTWVNCEVNNQESHTTSADGGAWDSSLLAPGESFAREFAADGSFSYFCRPHPSMRGAVIVD